MLTFANLRLTFFSSSTDCVLCCRVTCEDITERKCISVPELMEDTEVVDKCETVEAAAPSCTMLELELPKQVCKELVYGAAYDHRV